MNSCLSKIHVIRLKIKLKLRNIQKTLEITDVVNASVFGRFTLLIR